MRDPVIREAYETNSEFRGWVRETPGYWAELKDPKTLKRVRAILLAEKHPPPPAKLLDSVEANLTALGDNCVGNPKQWYRSYSYALDHEKGGVDTNSVWITLRRGGHYQAKVGTRDAKALDELGIDDSQYEIATGDYDVRRQKVTLDDCGPNLGS